MGEVVGVVGTGLWYPHHGVEGRDDLDHHLVNQR